MNETTLISPSAQLYKLDLVFFWVGLISKLLQPKPINNGW